MSIYTLIDGTSYYRRKRNRRDGWELLSKVVFRRLIQAAA